MPITVKMTLRLPHQVHIALNKAADEERKSLNQLIVDRLNASVGGVFVSEDEANASNLLERLTRLESAAERIETLEAEVYDLSNRLDKLALASG